MTTIMTLVSRYGASPSQEAYDAIYQKYLDDCAAAKERGRSEKQERKSDVDFLARTILRILEDHDRCPPQARDGSRRNGTANLILAACRVDAITKEPTHADPQRNNYTERYDGID